MKLAKFTYWAAAMYGALVTLPLFFSEQKLGVDYPPPINHAEYYYAFAAVTLIWQVLFVFIASDPVRFRPIMVPTVFEKLCLLPAFLVLFPQGRFPQLWIPLMIVDLAFGAAFLFVYIKSRPTDPTTGVV